MMHQQLSSCPNCGYTEISLLHTCKDHLVSQETFTIHQCKGCHVAFTSNPPSPDNIGKYYDSPEYLSHTSSKSLLGVIYSWARQWSLAYKLRIVKKVLPHGKTLMDYGCGTGHFMEYFKKKGWTTQGVEINHSARAVAITKSLTVSESFPSGNTFDLITAWHVLEHLYNPVATLKQFKEHLNEGGRVIIAVPNYRSYDSKHYGSYWAGYDTPRHLYHFSSETMTTIAVASGLKVIDTFPLKLDAFYVSLLSEQHMTGKGNWLSAFRTGLRSNRKAKKSGEYSSLIYILAK